MNGIVVKSTGSWFTVRDTAGVIWPCRIKGKIRLKGLKSTNPVAVGDKVVFETESSGDKQVGVITTIQERDNYIIRKSNKLSSQSQILAANIDQAVLFVTLAFPRTSSGFIDRFLVTAEAYHIPVILVFNKSDLYDSEMLALVKEWIGLYESLGYKCCVTSSKTLQGIQELQAFVANKTTLLCGHSGVGKSTVLNILDPSATQKTGEISDMHEKGKHTTTFAEMFSPDSKTHLIDTPGIRDFGVIDIEKEEIAHYFPEMRLLLNQCRFHNCLHVNEPGCAVIQAVEKGALYAERYYNYLSILNNEDLYR